MIGAGPIAVFLVSIVMQAVPADVAKEAPQATPCMECHHPKPITIDPEQFSQSVHGKLACTDCHTKGVAQFPHTASLAGMPDCTGCHSGSASSKFDSDKMAQEVKASVHSKMVDPAFRCTNCHSPHYFIPASRMTDASAAILVFNRSCLGCHAAGETPAAERLALEKLADKHRLFPDWKLHIQRNVCVSCHTPSGFQELHLILPKAEALKDCTACHAQNSLLVTKLYTHLVLKERAKNGLVNAGLFNNSYLTGATRNRWIDWGTVVLAGLTLFGVAAHGTGRWLFARFRRKA